MRLKGKVALITGAGSGMGKAMAHLFAAEGAKLVLADISGEQNEVAAALGEDAVAVHANVAEEADVQSMIATAEQKFGRLDILCNNAGFGGGMAALHEQSTEAWDRVQRRTTTATSGPARGRAHSGAQIVQICSHRGVTVSNQSTRLTAARRTGWARGSGYGTSSLRVRELAPVLPPVLRQDARSGPGLQISATHGSPPVAVQPDSPFAAHAG